MRPVLEAVATAGHNADPLKIPGVRGSPKAEVLRRPKALQNPRRVHERGLKRNHLELRSTVIHIRRVRDRALAPERYPESRGQNFGNAVEEVIVVSAARTTATGQLEARLPFEAGIVKQTS